MLKLGKKINLLLIFWALFYFFIFGYLLKNSFAYLDPDLGWHLKVGEEISISKNLPHINTYNYTFTGGWVDHEWLINLISFDIYNYFGYLGLNIFFAAIIVLALILLNIFARRFFSKVPDGLFAILQFIGVVLCSPHFGVRMQEFSFLFLILELWIISVFSKEKKKVYLFWLLPLFYLWANIHGSFLFGLGLLFFWLAVKIIERHICLSRWHKYFNADQIIRWSEAKIFLFFSLGAIVVTFFTPYGLKLYSFLSGYKNTFYLGVIQEWAPQFNFPFNYGQLLYLAFVVFALLIYFYYFKFKKIERINFWQISLVLFFLILGFSSRRNFPLVFAATFVFLSQTLYSVLEWENIKIFSLKKELKYVILICLCLVGLSAYAGLKIVNDPFNYFCHNYPCQAVAFLKDSPHLKDYQIFNDYNWGGYLIWTYPEKKIFIDGRIPQTEYAGHTFLEEYFEFLDAKADYDSKLKQYDIKLVLIKTDDYKVKARSWEKFIFWIAEKSLTIPNYLRRHLENSDNWEKVYTDSVASVYLRIK